MKLQVAGLVALVLATTAATARPSSPIAFISMQKILAESADAKAASKRLEELKRQKSEEITEKRKALEATSLELANAGGYFKASKRAELQAKEKRQQTELQQSVEQVQVLLQKAQQDEQDNVRRKLGAAVDTIAKRRGAQLVLNTDTAVVWAATGTDLTADVLAELSVAAAKAEKAPAPGR